MSWREAYLARKAERETQFTALASDTMQAALTVALLDIADRTVTSLERIADAMEKK
jgi:hypothetical protein